jgi:ribonuclease VapC
MNALVLDSSALIALYLNEPAASWVIEQYNSADRLLMSTVNLAECLMVFRSRNPGVSAPLPQRLLDSGIEFIAPDTAQALLAAEARDRYPLNLGDTFAYALAKTQNLPLLTLDRDFRSTDIAVILPPQS